MNIKDLTIEDIKKAREVIDCMEETMQEIAYSIFKLRHSHRPRYWRDIQEFDDNTVSVMVEDGHCGDCMEEELITFPTSYLWDTDYYAKEEAKITEKKEKALREKAEKAEAAKIAQEKAEREQYLKLKARFEG